jgi:hypothetical protein
MANPNTMTTQFNFNIQTDNDPKQYKSDGKKMRHGRGPNYRNVHDINFTSVAKLGLAIRQVRMANEIVGSYTGDRLTQRSVTTAMTFIQYGIGITQYGLFGAAYVAGDLAFRTASFNIRRSRENQISNFIKDISGNNARNQSRSSGDKL